MIRILVVDDHLAVRSGLVRLIRAEPGFGIVGLASGAEEAISRARHLGVDVAVVDHHLRDGDGLGLCRQLKALPEPPRVLIYSAFADSGLTIPALLAGSDGLLDKGASADELFDAIRTVSRGESAFPTTTKEGITASAGRLPPEDLPILGMLVDRTPLHEVAAVLRIERRKLEARIDTMIERLA